MHSGELWSDRLCTLVFSLCRDGSISRMVSTKYSRLLCLSGRTIQVSTYPSDGAQVSFSPIADREMISEGIGYHLQQENAFLVLTKSIDGSPFCDIPPTPPRTVRMESRTAFLLKLLPGHRVEFCQISHDDLKFKYVPSFVTNYLSQGTLPFEMIQSLKKVMSNYEGSKWDKRVQQRRDFYQEIEERVREEVEVINVSHVGKEASGKIVVKTTSGSSLWKALCIMSTLVAIARWTFDRFRIPGWACIAWSLSSLLILTHCVHLHQCSQNTG